MLLEVRTTLRMNRVVIVALTAFPQISFIIPIAAQPEQCYNEITPRDMYSSLSCAWSGALLEVGSMAAVVWSKFFHNWDWLGASCGYALLTYCSPPPLPLDSPACLLGLGAYRFVRLDRPRPRLGPACPLPRHLTSRDRRLLSRWRRMHTKPQRCLCHLVRLADRLRRSWSTDPVRHNWLLPCDLHEKLVPPRYTILQHDHRNQRHNCR